MRIKRVALSNWKGITKAFDLGPVTLIVGPNGSGKTAITTAIKFALTGQLPVFGKKAQSLYRLAEDPERAGTMSVALSTSPDGVITHEWSRSEKGVVSYAGNIPAGIGWSDAMLDFRRFLDLPASDQAREMFSRCKTDATPHDYLDKELDGVTAANLEVGRECVAKVRKELGRSADSDLPLGRWIEGAEAWLKQQISEATTKEKQAGAALKAHQGARPERVTADAEKLTTVMKDLAEAQAGIAAGVNAWRKYERDLAAYNSAVTRKDDDRAQEERRAKIAEQSLRDEIEQFTNQSACPTCGAEAEGWQKKAIAALEKRIVNVRKHSDETLREISNRELPAKPRKPEETGKAQTERIQQLQGELQIHQQAGEAQRRYADWRERSDSLESESSAATGRLEVLKEAQKRLREWRDKLINEGVAGILAVANKFTAGLLDAPLEWHAELGEFGRRKPGKGWVALDAFSGFEEQLAFAALSVAVASETKVKLVIMDELGRMTRANKNAVLARMVKLIQEGVIDQFIGVDVSRDDYAAPGINVIQL